MICSPARIEANRRNARKSTGPRTEGAMARSRLNAFKLGPAGVGDLLGPADDARAAEIAEESGSCPFGRGRTLALRAVPMSVRRERAETHARVAVVARELAAPDEFDRGRMGDLFARRDVASPTGRAPNDGGRFDPAGRDVGFVPSGRDEGGGWLRFAWRPVLEPFGFVSSGRRRIGR